jgi:UDP-N-acetylglucosamine 2-epimerase (non-hydrolysing)
MSPIRVSIVIGTRPEAIKMAPVVLALRGHPAFQPTVVATAQHRDMLDQVLSLFAIEPDVDLDLMREDQQLTALTASLLTGLERVWRDDRPDVILVQGDTTSAFAASLVALYLKVPVGHVEAGLRTGDKHAPFPEEMNRRLVDVLCDYYFAPTECSRANLLREHVPAESIYVTGNTGVDAFLLTAERIARDGFVPDLNSEIFARQGLVVVTAHRRESFGEGFVNICSALRRLAAARPDVSILYSVHPNPNVRVPVREQLADIPNVYLTDPLDYRSFVYVMTRANVILTDSGGIQEEAPSLGTPVLVMRSVTERTEAVDAGVAEIVGTDPDLIVRRATELLQTTAQSPRGGDPGLHPTAQSPRGGDPGVQNGARTTPRPNPFGDGRAAERIVRILQERVA